MQEKERYLGETRKRDYTLYHQPSSISIEEWKALLTDEKIVTVKNLDLLLRIYAIGDEVGPKELSKEEGYSNTYPYKEVITALGKRIKAHLHIDAPISQNKKSMFWHILFNGGIKDNNAFEWSLRQNLRQAITELIEEGKITEVSVQSKTKLKTNHAISETTIIEETPSITKEEQPFINKKEPPTDFDKLFEAIMAPSFDSQEEVKENTTSEIEKVSLKADNQNIKESVQETIEVNDKSSDIQETIKQESPMDYKERIKKECIDYYGAICDLCGFDFGYTYGEKYENYIEVYNIHGVKGEIIETTNPKEDLIPVCCNCYRVIHSQDPPISVEQMRKMIKI